MISDINFTSSTLPASAEPYVYRSYYSYYLTPSLVGIQGIVALEPWSGILSTNGTSCANQMACIFDGDNGDEEGCFAPPRGPWAVGVDSDGSFYGCDVGPRAETREDLCFVNDNPDRTPAESNAYYQTPYSPVQKCLVAYMTRSDLQDPKLFANSSPEDLNDLENYYYFVYYDDDECRDVVGLKAFISNNGYDVPKVSEGVSCPDSMSCLYNPDGESCSKVKTDDVPFPFSYQTGENIAQLSSCRGTVVDEEDEECAVVSADSCLMSGVFPGCHIRYASAVFLAENPGYLVGETDATTTAATEVPPTSTTTEVPPATTAPESNTNGACFLRVPLFVAAAGSFVLV